MCRMVAYVGPPVSLGDLVLSPPHSLVEQSYAPRELLRGTVCADGFGVGWYADGDPQPALYRRECPIWADPDLAGVARVVRSGCLVGAIRNATPELAHVGPAAVQPFAFERFLFAHNGFVADFLPRARGLRELLPDDLYAAHRGGGDSETLFMILLAHVREAEGDLARGVAAGLAEVGRRAPGSALNVVMTDGRRLVAARFRSDDGAADSLYVLSRAGSVCIASEPLDGDAAWVPVAQGNMVVVYSGAEVHHTMEIIQ
jgi:gamma-glutamyl hercynylcysteine S-oxide hydrolase